LADGGGLAKPLNLSKLDLAKLDLGPAPTPVEEESWAQRAAAFFQWHIQKEDDMDAVSIDGDDSEASNSTPVTTSASAASSSLQESSVTTYTDISGSSVEAASRWERVKLRARAALRAMHAPRTRASAEPAEHLPRPAPILRRGSSGGHEHSVRPTRGSLLEEDEGVSTAINESLRGSRRASLGGVSERRNSRYRAPLRTPRSDEEADTPTSADRERRPSVTWGKNEVKKFHVVPPKELGQMTR